MRLAVAYKDGQVFQHFGHTAQFMLLDAEDGRFVRREIVATEGSGHGALAGFLREQGVGAVICGGIGGGARLALAQAGILVYGGVQGDADAAAQAWLDNSLVYDPGARCAHHDSEHGGHACGGQQCGGHSCGGQRTCGGR